jgi:2-C-methyl-D-erythritol 4-phosphate cytidylyltransferase
MGGRGNKLQRPLADEPLLLHTLRVLQASPEIRWILVAARPEDRAGISAIIRRGRITKALPPVAGGASRGESVACAFGAVPARAAYVLVHDGARPCLTPALVSRAVREAARHGAAVCGLPAAVTVKEVDQERRVRVTLDRDRLWFVQTPQVFRRDWFAQALDRTGFGRAGGNGHAAAALQQFPDDASLLEAAGFAVRMVPGDAFNIKVTTPEDLVLAEAILKFRAKGPSAISRQRSARARPSLKADS